MGGLVDVWSDIYRVIGKTRPIFCPTTPSHPHPKHSGSQEWYRASNLSKRPYEKRLLAVSHRSTGNGLLVQEKENVHLFVHLFSFWYKYYPRKRKTEFLKNLGIPQKIDGADSQIRTGDLILTKDALYLLSYISKAYAPYGRGIVATEKGLEPSTSGVTGRRSNRLSYSAMVMWL